MRYKYTITKEGGETEEMEAMSWKKFFKSLLLKTPKFSGKIAYINKKKKYWQTKAFKKKQNDMIRFLMKGLRKYGYSVKVAN